MATTIMITRMVTTIAYATVACADPRRSLGYRERIEELTPSFQLSCAN